MLKNQHALTNFKNKNTYMAGHTNLYMIIKQIPEDFKVTEIIKVPKQDKTGKYTYFWLEKTNYTTTRALEQIARALRISKHRLHFSGEKDKNAITKQLVSAIGISPEILSNLNIKDMTITPIHSGKERVSLGMHDVNHFEITVRDLPKIDLKQIKSSAKKLQNGYPNYFDEQRFSSSNVLIGKALLRGFIREAVETILIKDKKSETLVKSQAWQDLLKYYDKPHSEERTIATYLASQKNDYTGALRNLHKKVRMLYIHAYQSDLFNKALSSTIKKPISHITISNQKLAIGSVPAKALALPGFDTKLSTSIYDKALKKLLSKDGISLEDFKCKRTPELASSGNTRPAIVKPNKLKINKLDSDELNQNKSKVTISFDLPKGAYATLFIKLLFQEY